MLENIYTTKMSANRKQLQSRFTKIRSKNGRISKLMALVMSVVIAVTMLCATIVMAAFDSFERYDIQVYYNNEIVELKNKPLFYENSVYVPLREMMNNIGLENDKIIWNYGKITVYVNNDYYKMGIGDNSITFGVIGVDTQETQIAIEYNSPILMNGVTYIPFEYLDYLLNRYDKTYNLSYTFGDIDSNMPYFDNAEKMRYYDICYLQYQVDNGHFPWRLDAQQVIQTFFTNRGMENGEITAFAGDGVKCSATYTIDDTSYIVELFKPVQNNEHGIWIVKEYYNANQPFAENEIKSEKAVVKKYFNANIANDREAIISTLTEEHNTPNMVFWLDEKIELNNIELDLTDEIKDRYLTNGRGQANSVSPENVIVFKVDFTVSYNESEKSAYNVGRYTDYSMILIRDNANGNWLIDDMGY